MVDLILAVVMSVSVSNPGIGQAVAEAVARVSVPLAAVCTAPAPSRPKLRVGVPPPLTGYQTW